MQGTCNEQGIKKGTFKEQKLPLSTACLQGQNEKRSKKKLQGCRDRTVL